MHIVAAIAGSLGILCAPLDAWAQGHAQHASTEQLGTVDFRTSCEPAVQPGFNRAVALLHSFQFGPAIDGFHKVVERDPDCTIAYWGIALASWSNPFAGFKSPAQLAQGWQAVQAGRAKAPRTARERAYVDAVAHLYIDSARIPQPVRLAAYEAAMAKLAADYPDDTEARIFDALALAAAADPRDQTHANQHQAGVMLEALFAQYPDHPGLAHYIIHAYDEPSLAARAAAAARRYGNIAPSTPHALHMPSHTFTRIGEWQASIDTNMASAASARRAGQPADELHANDYMVYAYLQTAQDGAARKLVAASAQIFQRFDPAHASGAAPASAAFFANAAIPARYCLERRDWAAAMALMPGASPFPYADAITLFTRGLGAAHLNNTAVAQQSIGALAAMRDRLTAAKTATGPTRSRFNGWKWQHSWRRRKAIPPGPWCCLAVRRQWKTSRSWPRSPRGRSSQPANCWVNCCWTWRSRHRRWRNSKSPSPRNPGGSGRCTVRQKLPRTQAMRRRHAIIFSSSRQSPGRQTHRAARH
jgi:hypothetical protein